MMKDNIEQELAHIPFQELLEALQDDEHVLLPHYLYRLSDLPPDELDALQKIWGQVSIHRRQTLLEDLEHLTETNNLLSFEAIFCFALHDKDALVRFYALRAIEAFDTNYLVPQFLELLTEDKNIDVRAVTASILGKYIYRGELDKLDKKTQRKIEQKLLAIIESGEKQRVRRCALEALGYSPLPEVAEHITKAYQSEDEEWVASALFAMGRSLDNCWDEKIISNIHHQNPKVRAEAIRAAGELGLEDTVSDILRMLDDVPQVREAAIWALSQIGGEGVEEALSKLLDEPLTDEEFALIEEAIQRLPLTKESSRNDTFGSLFSVEESGFTDDYD